MVVFNLLIQFMINAEIYFQLSGLTLLSMLGIVCLHKYLSKINRRFIIGKNNSIYNIIHGYHLLGSKDLIVLLKFNIIPLFIQPKRVK
jgi:hypothetical protein